MLFVSVGRNVLYVLLMRSFEGTIDGACWVKTRV